ncbi:MAG: site-specific DNA-methyltransferase [Candidatus Poribacteria bacterium]|nr:site-specific DNA-methyltransferase [Candidatus Poribacteria bacterium]
MPTLEFDGKTHIQTHYLTVPHRSLDAVPEKSIAADPSASRPNEENLIIHGDNLHALKALLPRYAGRVKCVYIDPPYNTGNKDWVYSDNVNSDLMRKWLEDKKEVDDKDLERHDKWLCMMWPRLQLLRELLSDDGAIFVSIDDNEQHRLRMIMDEIFGEENFRNAIIVRRGVKNVQAQFKNVDKLNIGSEYLLFYSKSREQKFQHMTVEKDIVPIGTWNSHWRGTDRPTMRYELMGIVPETGQWRWSQERSLKAIKNYSQLIQECGENPSQQDIDEWWFSQSPEKPDLLRLSTTNRPVHYVPPSKRRILSSLWTDMTVNESPSLLKTLGIEFPNPKRVALIQRIVGYITDQDANAVILDSFAGSGTTAHAVLALNKEDGGNRQFILVECLDYADCITAKRVRRVIKGVPSATDEALREGLGGSFTYCELGEPISIEGMLTGEALPSYESLASYLLYTAAGVTVESALQPQNEDGLFYQDERADYYLLYEPDIEYLRGKDARLNLERAERIHETERKAVVFGIDKFIGQRKLTTMGITFCQLPYCISSSLT